MATTAEQRAALGAPTTNRKWWLDLLIDGAWVPVMGLTELQVNPGTGNTQDDSDFDGQGFKSQAVTSLSGGVTGKVSRKTVAGASTAYDPGQEHIRTSAVQIGPGNVVHGRVYEMEAGGPRVEAYEFDASSTWSDDGGNMEALSTASITLPSRGQMKPIPHPDGTAVVASVSAVLPSGGITGDTVAVRGYGFSTGSTAAGYVKFGGDNATSYKVLGPDLIQAVVPAGDAGAVVVTVGGSSGFPYTRGA